MNTCNAVVYDQISDLAKAVGWSEARTRAAVRRGLFTNSAMTRRGDRLFTADDVAAAQVVARKVAEESQQSAA